MGRGYSLGNLENLFWVGVAGRGVTFKPEFLSQFFSSLHWFFVCDLVSGLTLMLEIELFYDI